ncbi:zinc ABC transporter substrate-binding protein [Microbacterium esteraromaticum]|uniref:Zinc ABC transporter substrate-binding protein n=1 Tax=Microbacterium esteraromaticum TaxID=57043 RepID=A0A939DT10_9MICO|nr:zinc ABC transporter substrate-binding protein [Microbacterium esteraromaticum]MBN8204610.1 zinc ABC transporter substrate-binding protein [Microbacterium esteraromaticum]MBN8414764.1 zinc ABC transporter substrate-binding protein [Microbacterium esteraromaticum]
MKKSLSALALAAASVMVLSGCSATAGGTADSDGEGGLLQVVASTNVYGQLAASIGGDRVEVTSLIDSAAKDPHSYEATARDRLAVQKADLVIENGGGYDAFIQELAEGSDAVVITAAEFSHDYPDAIGDDHADDAHAEDDHDHAEDHSEEDHAGHSHIEGFNEHVWFDVHTISHVTEQIAADLSALDPEGEADYTAALEELNGELSAIETELDELHERLEGTTVFITEPLPGLLAAAAGLDDVAPDGFASAVEEGNDVAPATLLEALAVIEDGTVGAVLTNVQTGGAETDRVEQAATDAGIPVVAFSELLEADQTYAEWMRAAISDLAAALDE